MTAPAFAGFPADGLEFYAALEADNSKVFWQANKARYEASVRGPMEALLAAVDEEFGPFHIFRPYNDVRFSKNKAPYKTAIGAVSESPDRRWLVRSTVAVSPSTSRNNSSSPAHSPRQADAASPIGQ